MTAASGLRVSHFLVRWGCLGLISLGSHCAMADALESWTSHLFPEVQVAMPGWTCSQFTTNGLQSVTNGVPLLNKLLFKDRLFVAVGTGPCQQDTPTIILRSFDAVNWQRSTNQGVNGFFGATATPNLFMGVGFWGQILISANGSDWAGAASGLPDNLFGVAYAPDNYVAVSQNYSGQGPAGRIITSVGGVNWAPATVSGDTTGGFTTVAYGNGRFFAATPTRVFRSMGTLGTGTNFLSSGLANGARLLCFGNDRFLLVGNDLRVCTNVNGAFLTTPPPTSNRIDTLTFGAGMFVGTAERDVLTSIDGFNWTVRTNVLPGRASDLTFGNGVFMAMSVPSGPFSGNGYYLSQPVARVSQTAKGALLVQGVQGRDYDILGTNVLTASSWPVLARIRLTNSPQPWVDDPSIGATNGARFYRTRLVP